MSAKTSRRTLSSLATSGLIAWVVGCGTTPTPPPSDNADDESTTAGSDTDANTEPTTNPGGEEGEDTDDDDPGAESSANADDNSSDAAAPPTVTSAECGQPVDGERLQVVRLVGADGSWEMSGWYDTQLEERCQFFPAVDGVERCMPFGQTLINPPRYHDADCTVPIAVDVRGSCEQTGPPRFLFVDERVEGCPTTAMRPFALGESLGSPDTVYLLGEDGTCQAQLSLTLDGTAPEVYEILGELLPEAMVSADYEARGQRVQDSYLRASDGASASVSGPYDTATSTSCRVDLAADGAWRCVPVNLAPLLYTDANCSEAVARVPVLDSCPAPESFFESKSHVIAQGEPLPDDPAGCPERVTTFQLRDASQSHSATALYTVDPLGAAQCLGSTLDVPVEVVEATLMPPETYARATFEEGECDAHASSGTRLKRRYAVLEDGYRVRGSFFDSELGDYCRPELASDEVFRCLPVTGGTAVGYFADPGCTQRAAAVRRPCPVGLDESLVVSPRFAHAGVEQAQCRLTYDVYELGSELSEVYRFTNGASGNECTLLDSPSPELMFKEVISVVPASSFVPLEESH